ncbi:MAG: peptidoglycan bridge formation glycyltransferase FemA/FemB family protein, partial [Patescibacteria group bacterium]
MEIKEIRKEDWNSFLLQNGASFLQSFEWGIFQEKLGRKTWQMSVEDGGQVILQALVVKKPLALGKSYLYIPFGPCFKSSLSEEQKKRALEVLLGGIRKIAKVPAFAKASSGEGKSVYCYVEPRNALSAFMSKLGARKPQKRVQPQQTLVIDLIPTEEQIFKNLKSKTTRYNIRF